jgi:hypothetical protein
LSLPNTSKCNRLSESIHGWHEPCPEKVRKANQMNPSSADKYLLWDRQQLADRERGHRELREWVKNFALVFSLVVLTVAAATVLAGQG